VTPAIWTGKVIDNLFGADELMMAADP